MEMSDQFGMPMVDCRPTHEVITELRQQLTAAQAELEAERNRRFEGNRISSQEYNDSQKREVMLRDVMREVLDAVWLKTSHELASKFSEALSATADLDQYILCEREPECWYDKHGMITHDPFEGVSPLYRAKEQA